MDIIYLLLLIIAAVSFGVAAFATRQPTRVNLVALGLLAWVLVPLVQAFTRLE